MKTVLIGRVEPGSSADTAGLRPYDLLLSYDDQRLLAPEQLSRLVALDQPGREVALKLVRGGEVLSVQAILGQAPMSPLMEHPWRTWPFGFFHPMPHLWGPLHCKDLMRAWRNGEWMQY